MPAEAEVDLAYSERDFKPWEERLPAARGWSVSLPEPIRPPHEKPSKLMRWLRFAADTPSQFSMIWMPELDSSKRLDFLFDFQSLLDFKGDPDDEGFVPISQETVQRAKRFLANYVGIMVSNSFIPIISPGPDGSVDVHWKTPRKEFLVNIPPDENAPALFYGDDYGKLSIEGKIDTNTLAPSIIMWLLAS